MNLTGLVASNLWTVASEVDDLPFYNSVLASLAEQQTRYFQKVVSFGASGCKSRDWHRELLADCTSVIARLRLRALSASFRQYIRLNASYDYISKT